MFRNMTIKNKIILLSILPIIALIGMLSLAITDLKTTAEGVDRIYSDRVVPLKDLKVIADDYAVLVIDAINKANAGMFTAEETDKIIASSESEISDMWKKYMATTLTKEEAKLANEAESLFVIANSAIKIAHNKIKSMTGNIAGQLSEFDGPLYQAIDPISEKITELINLQLRVAKIERDLIIEEYESELIILVSIASGIIAILIVLCIAIYSSIIGAILSIRKTVEKVIADSDLSIEIEIRNENELSAIARSFNSMVVKTRKLVAEVSKTSEKLNSSASEMTTVSSEAKKSINNQRQELELVAAAMNEMVSTAQEISNNAETADQGAKDTSIQAQDGQSIVNEAVEAANLLVTDVENVAIRIKTLETDSNDIGSIVDVIKGIADQTNLLALNAAIEAARAGDQGRGFAVVADEVRTLAQRTQVSTQQIQDGIERLQSGTSGAVIAMQNGSEKAKEAGIKATQAGIALDSIAKDVLGITDMNALIATAAEEQTNVSEEINKSLISLHDTSSSSSAGAEQISLTSEDLFQLSKELEKTISIYKI